MKSILLAGCLMLGLFGFSQVGQRLSSIADPKVGRIMLTDMAGRPLDADNIPLNGMVKLRIPVSNTSGVNTIPMGSAKLKIGLGTKLEIDPASLQAAGMDNVFRWTAGMVGGQAEITGEVIGEFPADVQDIFLAFRTRAAVNGKSTITANFLISNHDTRTILSDMDPTNNSSFLQYTIVSRTRQPEVKITKTNRGACSVNLVFTASDEAGMHRYDVEVSKDGINYVRVSEVAATQEGTYRASFNIDAAIETASMLVRIKGVDLDGNYRYSTPQTVNGTCSVNQQWALSVYPNPVTSEKAVTVSSTLGNFNGKYKVTMLDVSGKVVSVKELTLERVTSFRFGFGQVANGVYFLEVVNTDGSQSGTLKFEKL